MSQKVSKIIVCGGNGFIGSRICKNAVARGWDVTSISRSGEPKWEESSGSPPSWAHKVSWERADILRPSTYAPLLRGADHVVHSMGIIMEADYKGAVSGRESPLVGLRKVFAASSDRGVNPLELKPGQDIKATTDNDQYSYEVMNRDTAVALARHAAAENVPNFCFVSASGGAPVLPDRYLKTKREAETTIASSFPAMRAVFPRPPLLYDTSRPVTVAAAAMAGGGAVFNRLTGGYFNNFLGAAGTKPMTVDTVAEAIVEALADKTVRGPIEVPQLEELSSKAWRKTML